MGSFEFVTHERWVTFMLSKGVEDPYKGRMSRACVIKPPGRLFRQAEITATEGQWHTHHHTQRAKINLAIIYNIFNKNISV